MKCESFIKTNTLQQLLVQFGSYYVHMYVNNFLQCMGSFGSMRYVTRVVGWGQLQLVFTFVSAYKQLSLFYLTYM